MSPDLTQDEKRKKKMKAEDFKILKIVIGIIEALGFTTNLKRKLVKYCIAALARQTYKKSSMVKP